MTTVHFKNMIKLKKTELSEKFEEYAAYVLEGGYKYDFENKNAVNACIEVLKNNKLGLMIAGNPGSGKTLFFEIMQKIISPQDASMFVKVNVLEVVLQFNNKEVGHGVFRKWQDKNVFFDDLGTEDKGKLYADTVEVFEKFIQFRYDLWRSKKIKTHFTTNLSKEQLTMRYGTRCISRLGEMCEVVLLGNSANYTDRRKYRNFITLPPVHHEKILSKEEKEWLQNYELAKKIAQDPIQNTHVGLGQRLKKQFGFE